MKRIHTTLVIAGLSATIVGWQLWQPAAAPANLSKTPQAGSDPSAALEAAQEASELRRSATADSPDLARRIQTDPDCYVDQIVLHPESGEAVDAIACAPVAAESRPYETWSEQVLAGLAYGDPVAAEVLALRHIQSEDPNREALGLMLLYRSVALSGDTTALHRAISERYAVVSENGEPNVGNLKQLLVFAIIATRLGDGVVHAGSVESRLAKAEVDPEEVSKLKADAEEILREMASIEAEVTANSTIREALSNA